MGFYQAAIGDLSLPAKFGIKVNRTVCAHLWKLTGCHIPSSETE